MTIALILLAAQITIQSALQAASVTVTERLKNLTVHGAVRLDCANDSVFTDVFKLLSNADTEHRLFKNAEPAKNMPPVFLAWSTVSDQIRGHKHPRNVDGPSLVLTDAPVLQILEQVAKIRGRVVVECPNGWFLAPVSKRIPKDWEVLIHPKGASYPIAVFMYLPINSVKILDAEANDVVTFLNANLRRSWDIMREGVQMIKTTEFQITELIERDEHGKQIKSQTRLSFLGPCQYFDLIYVYGAVFDRKFTWIEPHILKQESLGQRSPIRMRK